MSTVIYLYLKTHNVTGLKYLGKTVQDPFSYSGSGKHWKRHLEKHGNNVTTEILFQSTDPKEFSRVASEYSSKLNIVESKEFANLCPENGQGGDTSMCFTEESYEKMHVSKPWSDERKQEWSNIRSGNGNPMCGKTQSDKQKQKASELARKLHSVKHECPHCGKVSNLANIKRWHMDNCKKR